MCCRQHLSNNIFFLYIFGKLVEEDEGIFGVWMTYLVTGCVQVHLFPLTAITKPSPMAQSPHTHSINNTTIVPLQHPPHQHASRRWPQRHRHSRR